MKSLLTLLFPVLVPAATAATVHLENLQIGWCDQTGAPVATCTVSGYERVDYGPYFTTGTITATDSATLASLVADTMFAAGEGAYGAVTLAGSKILTGGAGAGFAEFLLRWSLLVTGAWGAGGSVTAPGISVQYMPGDALVEGEAWSAPLSMIWDQPFSYSASLDGGFGNGPGDCCGGMRMSIEVVDWRSVADPAGAIIETPEPRGFLLVLIGMMLIAGVRRAS